MLMSSLPKNERVHNGAKKPLAGKRILVAEDEGLIALELERMLEDFGCEVIGPLASVEERAGKRPMWQPRWRAA